MIVNPIDAFVRALIVCATRKHVDFVPAPLEARGQLGDVVNLRGYSLSVVPFVSSRYEKTTFSKHTENGRYSVALEGMRM